MIRVYRSDDSGWWFGIAGDSYGWFPGSYVEVCHCLLLLVFALITIALDGWMNIHHVHACTFHKFTAVTTRLDRFMCR